MGLEDHLDPHPLKNKQTKNNKTERERATKEEKRDDQMKKSDRFFQIVSNKKKPAGTSSW